jgi:hypothetical protein
MINDQMGARQTLLKEGMMQTTHVDRTMHSRGEANLLVQQMDVQKPDLLWIRLAGYAIGSGNKVDRKRAGTLVDLANKQLNEERKLLLEADVHCGAWTLIEYQELCKRLKVTKTLQLRHQEDKRPHVFHHHSVCLIISTCGMRAVSMRRTCLPTQAKSHGLCREAHCNEDYADQ